MGWSQIHEITEKGKKALPSVNLGIEKDEEHSRGGGRKERNNTVHQLWPFFFQRSNGADTEQAGSRANTVLSIISRAAQQLEK